jgi:hypothetical protein
MNEQDRPPREQTKTELLNHNQRAFDELEALIQTVDDERLSRPGPSGWAVKDHLAHLAAWQQGIVALLQRRPRFAAMGVDTGGQQELTTDEINAVIHSKNSGLSAAEAKEKLREAHTQMAQQIESMSNDELYTPHKEFLPGGEEGPEEPVLLWIVGNASGHYQEHIEYIRDLLRKNKTRIDR